MSKRSRPRESRPTRPDDRVDRRPWLRGLPPLLSAIALALLVAGARWWLIGNYSSDVPWLDQWDAEAQGLYQPAHAAWFAPHNEHRIFFTRLLALGLLRANGQWDPRLQMVVNAGLYSVIFAALYLVLRRGKAAWFHVVGWILVAAMGCAPYAATNTLLGFQSQFYFLAGFSLWAMYALVNCRPGSAAWIAGAIAGAAALVSMASGYAAAVAVLAVLAVSGFRSRTRNWVSAATVSVLIAAGVLLRHSPPEHAALAAQSAGDFARMLIACLSWPGRPMIPVALITWLPFATFLGAYLKNRTKDEPAERFLLGIGFWALLQAAALAIYRANSGEGLEARYTDILAFGLLANALCAIWLPRLGGGLRRFQPVLVAAWFAVSGIGLYAASFDGAGFSWKRDMEIRRAATAGFLATGDQRYLDQAPPYPDARLLAGLLQDPAIRPILPAGVRASLPMAPGNGSPAPAMNALSTPDFGRLTADVWALPGMFSRFAVIPPSSRFEYRIEQTGGPRYLLFYWIGNPSDVAVADARQSRHRIVALPGSAGPGHHAIVACPAGGCVLTGASGAAQLAIREPKEIGILSVAALLAAVGGPLAMAIGGAAFLSLVVRSMLRISLERASVCSRSMPAGLPAWRTEVRSTESCAAAANCRAPGVRMSTSFSKVGRSGMPE